MQKTKSRIKVGLLKSCSATRAGYRCVLYQKSISLEAFLCLLHSMLIMWMEAFSCVKCRRSSSSRSVSFLLFHSHIRTLSCDFGFYSATDATWTCRQVQYLQLNECERMTLSVNMLLLSLTACFNESIFLHLNTVYYFMMLLLSNHCCASLISPLRILKYTLPSAGAGLHFQSLLSGCNDIVMTRRNTVISCLTETI